MRLCHISTLPPTQCGIATYAQDLMSALNDDAPATVGIVQGDNAPPPIADRQIVRDDESSYDAAVDYINASGRIDVVSLQHEFGIFGGPSGSFAVKLARQIKWPVVTTLHTIRRNMSEAKAQGLRQIADASARVVVLTEEGADMLVSELGVPAQKVALIPHGVPDVAFRLPEESAIRKRLDAPLVFISAGHLRPTKGYDMALEALAEYKLVHPQFKYVILGSRQVQFDGDAWYGAELEKKIAALGLEEQVVRIDRHLPQPQLLEWIQAADVGLVTYTEREQNASGILPLMLGCGRVVAATDFDYAVSVARQVTGVYLSKIDDSAGLHRLLERITADPRQMAHTMQANYAATRSWIWPRTAEQYCRVFETANS